jgi:CMP-N-acetylneuraminic acid synthetase
VKTLAVIPARGGSKGLPGKNARPFLGIPLLARAIRIAQETCDALIVTTDDPVLASLAEDYDAPVHMRPAELATDEAPMLPVVQDAIRGREGDVIVLLQPTQPLRTAEQVREALDLVGARFSLRDGLPDSVVSVRRVPASYSPELMLMLGHDGLCVEPVVGLARKDPPRRQAAQSGYVRCGTVYATHRDVIEAGSLYGASVRPLILEGDALSIDTLEDFNRLEALACSR